MSSVNTAKFETRPIKRRGEGAKEKVNENRLILLNVKPLTKTHLD